MATPGPGVGTPGPGVGTPGPGVGTPGPGVGTPGRGVGTPGPGARGTITSQYFNQLYPNGVNVTKHWRLVPDSDFKAETGGVMNQYECIGNTDEVGVAMDSFTGSFQHLYSSSPIDPSS